MVWVQQFEGLRLCSLTTEQRERTCRYWYTVTGPGATPHTAFRTRASLLHWLAARGLSVQSDVPAEGEPSSIPIIGSYRASLHHSYDQFYAVEGARERGLSNGEFTLTIISVDDDGLRTQHQLNPNCRDRPRFDYGDSAALIDAGQPQVPA